MRLSRRASEQQHGVKADGVALTASDGAAIVTSVGYDLAAIVNSSRLIEAYLAV
jgi:hypothetical protein